MKKTIFTVLLTLLVWPAASAQNKTAIVAHRGYWKCEQAGYSENSIAALRAAAEAGFWGCELDVHLTADGRVLVNHDGTVNGKDIAGHNLADFDNDLLPNGERRPTLDEYLAVAKPYRKTMLVIEFKQNNDDLVAETVRLLKKYGMFSPKRVMFIAFSHSLCRRVAAAYPKYTVQYLNGRLTPARLRADGINGLDYGFWEFRANPEWVGQAHRLGQSVNCWTVDYDGIFDEMLRLGVDAITTNVPMELRDKLGEREIRR